MIEENKYTVPDLYCPSIDACNQFGIRRRGADPSDTTYRFLNGPQFKNIKSYDYKGGKEGGAIDEVILEFIGNKTIRMKPETGENNIVKMKIEEAPDQAPLYTMRIAPSDPSWLKFGFNHTWNEGEGIVSKILDTIGGLLDSASGIINTIDTAAGGNAPRRKVTVDKQDQYASTEKIKLKIPFILFSSGKGSSQNPIEQWINDVYKPLILITAWSHPKRNTGIIEGKDANGKPVSINANDPNTIPQQSKPAGEQGGEGGDIKEVEEKSLQFLSSYPGVRVAISEPPSYVKVKHSSGFFSYNRCAISSFTYAFEGPWVKAYTLLSGDNVKMSDQEKQLMNVTIPMVAKCEIEIQVLEKMYADDWIEMFKNSPLLAAGGPAVKEGIVNVMNKPYSKSSGG